jgi:hypothetical protein
MTAKANEDLVKNLFGKFINAGADGEWWSSFQFPSPPDFDHNKLMNCARSALFGLALAGGGAVREREFASLDDTYGRDEIDSKIQQYMANFGRLVYMNRPVEECENSYSFYVFRGGAISSEIYNDGQYGTYARINVVGTSESHLQLAQNLFDVCVKGKDEQVETQTT